MHSAIYSGRVRHRRLQPKRHHFSYPVFMMYLDLDELDEVFGRRWIWSHKRPAPAWFRRSDYLGPANVPLKQAVYDRVEQETGQRPTGPVRLLTNLRYFGYLINPISCYYVFDQDNNLQHIVAEVTNTPWRETTSYVIPCDPERDTLHTFLSLTSRPVTTGNLLRTLLSYPLMTVQVAAAIYWQALRIYLKRIPFVPHPKRMMMRS